MEEQSVHGNNDGVGKMSKITTSGIPWSAGKEEDFQELHQAVKEGKTRHNTYSNDSSDNIDESSEEDNTEPPENQPGLRLLWAAQNNEHELIQTLLKSDPTLIHFRDDDGYTALHRASYSDHSSIALVLLKAGADISAVTEGEQWQPIHSASRWNSAKTVELLLSQGANVNATTSGGQTPLHLAAFCGKSSKSLQLLLSHPKLKCMTKNAQGDTAKDIALRNGNSVELFDLVQPAYRDLSNPT